MTQYLATNSINNFWQLILEQDLSENTLKALVSDLKHFSEWYEQLNEEKLQLGRVIGLDIIDYKKYCLHELEHKPRTINRRLASLRLLFRVVEEECPELKNPTKKVKQIPLQNLGPKSISEPDTRRLLKEVELRGSLRDKAIIYFMLFSGLRASELIGLKRADLELSERKGFVEVRNSKRNKTRVVPLNSKIRPILQELLLRCDSKFVLVGQRGPLKTVISINKIVERYAKFARVNCSPHSFRHTFARTYLRNNSGDLVGLAQILGHSSIQTTAIYAQNSLGQLTEKIENI